MLLKARRDTSLRTILPLLCLVLGVSARFSLAGEGDGADRSPPRLAIGAQVPDFELKDSEGRPHRLSGLRDAKAIVIAWTGIRCPLSRLYAPRLDSLFKDYREKGVQLLAVSSNPQDATPDLRAFAGELGFSFPVLKDHDGRVADLLGVERMTEVFLLDGALKLRYHGRVDDQYTITDRSMSFRKDRPEVHYLADALELVLAGKDVTLPRTESVGCRIARDRKPSAAAEITFHEHVEPILQKRCQSCHREGQIAPFALLTYEDAAGWSGMIAEVVENRRMPPWHADPRHGRFSNDRSLASSERETLIRWVEGGSLRGDPAKRPAPAQFPAEWQIGMPDVVLEMPAVFRVPARGKVRYQYSTIETGFDEDRWIQAMEVRAGSREVVHHILVFAVDPKDPQAWRRETGGGTQGFFAAMVPGEKAMVYPEGMAKRLPAGATLVFQIHYTTNGKETEDRSRIGLIFARGPVKREVRTRSAVNLTLKIPPGEERHEVRALHYFTRPTRLLNLLPHMHLRGSAFRYDLLCPVRAKVSKSPWEGFFHERVAVRLRYDAAESSVTWLGGMDDEAFAALTAYYTEDEDRKAIESLRKEGRTETLLDVPAYDFGWQSTYELAESRLVPAGCVLECTAIFNNSASNPALTRDMRESTVRWGNQTWEEMMIGYFDCIVEKADRGPASSD